MRHGALLRHYGDKGPDAICFRAPKHQPVDCRRCRHVRHLHGGAGHDRGQRVAAAHRRQSVGEHRRSRVGADFVPGGQRDHPADDGLDRQLLRAQAHLAGRGFRVHGRQFPVRAGDVAADADPVPRDAGRHRRSAAAAFAGGDAGSLPAAGPRQGDGVLGTGDRGGADAGPGDRRLPDGQFQLALGLLHQSAGGTGIGHHDAAVHLRSAVHRAAEARRRLLGHRDARAGCGRAAGGPR